MALKESDILGGTASPSTMVARRPTTPEDYPFLYEVYAASRADEMKMAPWTDGEKEAFLQQQFQTQDQYYRRHYPDATFEVLLVEGVPAGRLYVDRIGFPDEYRIMDIALLPEFRNQGIGTALIQEILMAASTTGRAVRLHVESFNPAQHLYERLGFRTIGQNGPYYFQEWRPAPVKL